MQKKLDELTMEMVRWYAGEPNRIQHFLKVWGFAALMGRQEGLDARTQEILEVAALVHDIGIRPAEEKYGSDAGPLQEREGEPAARALLTRLGWDEALVGRVSRLVGRHHTYDDIDGPDCQLLIEADFLVNLFESGASAKVRAAARKNVFRTKAGLRLLDEMFGT